MKIPRRKKHLESACNSVWDKSEDMSKTRFAKSLEGLCSETQERLQLPIIKQSDVPFVVPHYAAILDRTVEDGVGMKDLDHLQQDLEKLLSDAAVRTRMLKSEVDVIDQAEEEYRETKNGKSCKKRSIKRRRPDERQCMKYRDFQYTTRIIKTKYSIPFNHMTGELVLKSEAPKLNFPKNDTSDKFWLSIEPFCADVTKDDLAFIDELLSECSQDIDIRINKLGTHYALQLSHDVNKDKNGTRSTATKQHEELKNGFIIDPFSSPLAQGISTTFINKKLKTRTFCLSKISHNNKRAICMDRRLQDVLIDQEILDIEDLPKGEQSKDELLKEIKQCVQELQIVNAKNTEQLSKLKQKIEKDLERQDVRQALHKVDNQVMDVYNKILTVKQKHSAKLEREPFTFVPRLNLSEFDDDAHQVLDEQFLLHKEMVDLGNLSSFF